MYQDFTEKALPKIAEGMVITKEYFGDLFGRYVKYLIVSDSLTILLGVVMAIGATILLLYTIPRFKKWDDAVDFRSVIFPIVIYATYAIATLLIISSTQDLIKDIYIPEIRIYEEIKTFNH